MIKYLVPFFILLSMNVFSQRLNVSDMEVSDFVEAYKSGKQVDMKTNYLWTGSIISINRKDDASEITVLKSIWIDKNTLNNYKVILVTKDMKLAGKAEMIGLNKKIVFIVQITDIIDFNPVCIPLLIREI